MLSYETTAIHTQKFQTCNVQVHSYLIVIGIEDEMELRVLTHMREHNDNNNNTTTNNTSVCDCITGD